MANLAQKYRPAKMKQVFGNSQSKEEIIAYAAKPDADRPHTFLFHGPAGSGKTTMARIAANLFGANGDDVREYNNAAFRGIDVGREIIADMVYGPSAASTAKAYILDEVHSLTGPAQESLLKAIEEPPAYVYFFLCTTDPQKLLKTTKSRCIHVKTALLDDADMGRFVSSVAKAEGKAIPDTVVEKIVSAAQGVPRTALSLLNGALVAEDIENVEFAVEREDKSAYEICQLLGGRNPQPVKVAALLQELKDQGVEAEGIRRSILGYAQGTALRSNFKSMTAYAILKGFETPTYNSGFVQLTTAVYDTLRYLNDLGG